MTKKINYHEPAEYFPKSVRKAAGIGEYAKDKKTTTKKATKTTKKK